MTATPHNFRNLVGERFGRLVVLHRAENARANRAAWMCRCDCGSTRVVVTHALRSGNTTSCGCYRNELHLARFTKHGHNITDKRSPEYGAWAHIISRCENPNTKDFPAYGGRGIAVCERWRTDFASFLADLGPHPGPGYSIDRINNDGNYEPDNCRWATAKQQANNRRKARSTR